MTVLEKANKLRARIGVKELAGTSRPFHELTKKEQQDIKNAIESGKVHKIEKLPLFKSREPIEILASGEAVVGKVDLKEKEEERVFSPAELSKGASRK